ncbi:unnamed protein product [Arabidopsis lyrata]|uniref:protein ROS1 n=1 Tax=Arabidopsis lyrata subsp. lyrata TaxID=81972 RepID=UPI000A29B13B|nr:protein ROS1 [Arabidopsis lyrata subsp. lyrata]CAH8255860.1 unnamed protein product [Arabidopsis lyrata]|eukprot:XP_020889632.1 protein ROS1 [Arabidopsis lyrata subsp. lyrata]
MNSAEQINPTKPERSTKLVSFPSDLMILANKAAEEDESLQNEQAGTQGKRELMMQRKAKSTTAAKFLKEAKLNKGLELYQIYKRKKRVNESGLGGCTRFLRNNNLSPTLQHLSFGDLVVLANAASIDGAREVSKDVVVEAAEEYFPERVEEGKQRESGDMDCGGSCFVLSEELLKNRELMLQKGEAAPVKVVEEVKPKSDPSDGFRDDKLFKKKYVRRTRVKNKEQLESTSVGAVAGTCNLVKKLCALKPSSLLTNVDAAEREEGLLYNNGETQSKSEQGPCSGVNNKTKSGDETEGNAAAVSGEKQSVCLYSAWEREYPKRKRSLLIRKPKEPKKTLGKSREGKEQVCDQIDISEQEAETEEEGDVSDASNSSSRNLCSSFIFNVQWSNKRKRNCMKLEEAQSNRAILLIAVEAITNHLGLLDISI